MEKDLTLSYIDGNSCEFLYWQKRDLASTHLLCGCGTVGALESVVDSLVRRAQAKLTQTPDIIVLDELSGLLKNLSQEYVSKLEWLLTTGASKNIHVIYISVKQRLTEVSWTGR